MVVEIDDCNQMIALNSNDHYAYFQRARAKCSLGDYQGATEDRNKGRTLEIEIYNRMIAINPNPNSSDDFLERARYKKHIGDYQGAHNDYNQAILLNSNDHSIYTIRAEFREEIRDYQGAVDDYNQVILLKPKDSSSVYCNRVRILHIQKDIRNHQGIVDVCNQLISQKPDYLHMGDCYCDRAEAKYELGDYLGTIKDCNQSIKSESDVVRAYLFRASARKELGNYQEAIDDCDLAIYRYQDKPEYVKGQYFEKLLYLRNKLVQ
jgi:tetratricopeptide (TPR) repeat protein